MESCLQLIFSLLLLIVCSYLWIYQAYKSIIRDLSLRKNGVQTEGKVIQYNAKENPDGPTLYHPVIEFFEVSGERRVFESKSGSSERLRLGKNIVVYYDKENPENLIKGSSDLIFEFVKLCFGIAGCLLIIIYLLFWW